MRLLPCRPMNALILPSSVRENEDAKRPRVGTAKHRCAAGRERTGRTIMNLNREKFLAVVMAFGALASAVGCSKSDTGKAADASDRTAAPANESAPAPNEIKVAATPIVQQVPAR